MIIRKKKAERVVLSTLYKGDVFEHKDDVYMVLQLSLIECPVERKCVNLSNGNVFSFSQDEKVIPLKAELTTEWAQKGEKING